MLRSPPPTVLGREPLKVIRRPADPSPPSFSVDQTRWTPGLWKQNHQLREVSPTLRPEPFKHTPQRLESEDREPREATRHGRYERGIVSARTGRGTSTEGSWQGQAQPQARVHCRLAAPFGLLPARLRWLHYPYTKAAFTAPSTSAHVPCRKLLQLLPLWHQRPAPTLFWTNEPQSWWPLCVHCGGVCVCVSTHTCGMRWILNLHLRHHLPT